MTEPQIDLFPIHHGAFKEALEDMEKLLSQSKRTILLGAGCSKCAGLPLMDELTNSVLTALSSGEEKAYAVLNGLKKHFKDAPVCTIEDLMSELVDWISIAERRELRDASKKEIQINKQDYSSADLIDALVKIRSSIATCINESSVKIDSHRLFVRSIHGAWQSGKSNGGYTVDYFTLNYDSLIEDSLGLEQISYADGFSGGATGWWCKGGYDDQKTPAKVYKVHGSVDWCLWEGDVFPRRIRPGLITGQTEDPILIWPAATKYREAQRDPFAQILQMMRKSLRPDANSEMVLSICGYGFGDDHINIEIERALHESDQRLTLLVFISDNKPTGRLAKWLADEDIQDQVRVYANRGFFHGAKEDNSAVDLPWWRFEVLAGLLGGER